MVAFAIGAGAWGVARGSTTPPARRAGGSPAIAMVGPLRVDRDELDQQVKRALETYQARTKSSLDPQIEPLVRRQVLENLIRQRLLVLEARRRGLTVTDAEAEAEVRRDPYFQEGGMFNEAKYLAVKASSPDAYAKALASA